MQYSTLKSALYGNPTLLLRELIKYDKENVTDLLFKMNWEEHYIKDFTSQHKRKYKDDNHSAIVDEFFDFCFELGYDSMRINDYYNASLDKWGKTSEHLKYPEITNLWFDLEDSSKVKMIEKIGRENIFSLIESGFFLLHQAFKNKDYLTVEALALVGVDFNQKDNFGKTPKDYASHDAKGLDLYLKLNSHLNEDLKFDGLKKWFTENIKKIETSKYYKVDQIKEIGYWLNDKWDNFTLEQKQEIFTLSIGSNTKDICTMVAHKVEDRKELLNPQFPFWTALENCTVKQLAFSALKNTALNAYDKNSDKFFLENLATLFENLGVPNIMAMTELKEDQIRLKHLAESYFTYKDIWLETTESGPLLHALAKRQNKVFEVFAQHWIHITGPFDLVSHPDRQYLLHNQHYEISRMEKNFSKEIAVLNIPVKSQKLTMQDILDKTWCHQDSSGKYTFEYFMENHYKAMKSGFCPRLFEYLLDDTKEYEVYSAENKNLTTEKKEKLYQHYRQSLIHKYSPDLLFKILECTCVAFKKASDDYYGYMVDKNKMAKIMRSCYNILSLDEYSQLHDYSKIKTHEKLKDYDVSLYKELSSVQLNIKLHSCLGQKSESKKLKI